jgi:hypothetical protein
MIDTLESISIDIGFLIEEHYSDVGVMQNLKRRFKEDTIQQYADYFIRIDLASIEELGEERDGYEKRLSALRRARQDSSGDGNGDQVSERTGVYVNASVWNPQPRQVHGGLSGRGTDNDFGLHEERQDSAGADIDSLFHQAELLSPVVQLRSPDKTILETVPDSPSPFFANGTESKCDGLA